MTFSILIQHQFDNQHNIFVRVATFYYFAKCRYANCRYAECRGADLKCIQKLRIVKKFFLFGKTSKSLKIKAADRYNQKRLAVSLKIKPR
jgi:hypothetical protein